MKDDQHVLVTLYDWPCVVTGTHNGSLVLEFFQTVKKKNKQQKSSLIIWYLIIANQMIAVLKDYHNFVYDFANQLQIHIIPVTLKNRPDVFRLIGCLQGKHWLALFRAGT